jgi:hypothetical protein
MLWHCLECTTCYALDLQACPNCGSTNREESGMPKITVHEGPTNADEELKWAGTDSSASTNEPETNSEPSEPKDPSPARKTAASSSKRSKGSSTARSGRATTSGPETDGAASANPDEGGDD